MHHDADRTFVTPCS